MTTATEVKERPILFSGPMVRAILEGRKTQTRRVVTWTNSEVSTPKRFLYDLDCAWKDGSCSEEYLHVPFAHPDDGWPDDSSERTFGRWFPRIEIGDRSWVRETFIAGWLYIDGDLHAYDEDGNELPQHVWYRADQPPVSQFGDKLGHWTDDEGEPLERVPWKPSIHMPRWASRITLEVTDVRVERVQDISEEDAKDEGVMAYPNSDGSRRYIDPFRVLWNEINLSRGYGWESNPWVWVVEFERVDT